jgi:hypothetical protein
VWVCSWYLHVWVSVRVCAVFSDIAGLRVLCECACTVCPWFLMLKCVPWVPCAGDGSRAFAAKAHPHACTRKGVCKGVCARVCVCKGVQELGSLHLVG